MVRRDATGRGPRSIAAAFLFGVIAASTSPARGEEPVVRAASGSGLPWAVAVSVERSEEKLSRAECRQVFADFTVLRGEPHRSTLAAGTGDRAAPSVRFEGRRSATFEDSLAAAFADAARWLRRGTCLRVLSEFHDLAGRPLSRRIEEIGLPADRYLGELVVVDGDRRAICQSSRVLAATRPGSREIAFCGRRFVRAQMQNPDLAAAVVIHEALHALGLGENPPLPEEITGRVLELCGR
jgi:hypothetical protein